MWRKLRRYFDTKNEDVFKSDQFAKKTLWCENAALPYATIAVYGGFVVI